MLAARTSLSSRFRSFLQVLEEFSGHHWMWAAVAHKALLCAFAQEHLSNEASPCETAHWRVFSASM